MWSDRSLDEGMFCWFVGLAAVSFSFVLPVTIVSTFKLLVGFNATP